MKRKLNLAALCALLLLLPLLCACGAEKETVLIHDRGVTTELSVAFPIRVEQILEEAEIVLRDGDVAEPSAETELTEACEITILRENVVRLIVEDRVKTVVMHGGTVRELLEKEGIAPAAGQRLNCDPDDWLTDGMEIRLSGRCTVELCRYGQVIVTDVAAASVGEALTEAGILLDENDRVTPGVETPVADGMEIRVSRLSYAVVEQVEPVGFTTRYEPNGNLEPGTEELSVEGIDGEMLVSYRVTYVDGVEESREAIAQQILREPIDAVILTGPRDLSGLSIVSKKAYYDCDGSGHGYYEITYSDGSVDYETF